MLKTLMSGLGGDRRRPEALDVGTDAFDDADDEAYDPTEFTDDAGTAISRTSLTSGDTILTWMARGAVAVR